MQIRKLFPAAVLAAALAAGAASCSDDKTYAELLTDEAHYVNGAQLNVDGGWTAF